MHSVGLNSRPHMPPIFMWEKSVIWARAHWNFSRLIFFLTLLNPHYIPYIHF